MTSNLQQQAYKAIRKQIIYSELEPGTKISEKELEERLNIGRTPIREALIQLRNQELIYAVPQSGTYISQINIESISLARYTRELLEKAILAECSAKLTLEGQKVLQVILEETEQAALDQKKRDFFQLDNAFHQTCFEIAGKSEIWSWIESYSTHFDRFRWLRLNTAELDWKRVINEHHTLLQAIIHHDLDEISFLSSLHLHMIIEEQDYVMRQYPNYFIPNSIIT